ncbi:MAG: hypothetical protein J6K95_00805 [Rikenellaceae bacterium]|nr:hypothetical protein [Rikenellaceae bacterium]
MLAHGDTRQADSLLTALEEFNREDSVAAALRAQAVMQADSAPAEDADTLSRRQRRRLEHMLQDADTTFVRHSRFFRDSMSISKVTAISAVVPGFAQFYNEQYWKIPVLYTTVGTTLALGINQSHKYSTYRKQYDALLAKDPNNRTEELDRIQSQMIKHNTARQLLLAGAIASYIYFIGDGAVNYKSDVSSVKKATTLSMICPGAGQVYNKSYWKVPFVVGGFATMAYIIDWNNRGYQRFKKAYNYITDGDDSTVDEFNGLYDNRPDFIKNLRDNYRRNRDLSIIITAGFYLLNVIDAHVDAHLKDFDVSDDLTMTLEPTITTFSTAQTRSTNLVGMTLKFNF